MAGLFNYHDRRLPLINHSHVVVLTDGAAVVHVALNVVHSSGLEFFVMVMVESVKVEVRHQVRLYVVDRFREAIKELVEILFVEEHLMAVIATIFKALLAFGNGYEIVITAGCAHIEKVSAAFAGFNAF